MLKSAVSTWQWITDLLLCVAVMVAKRSVRYNAHMFVFIRDTVKQRVIAPLSFLEALMAALRPGCTL
jgi:hypothetical protein